ncbi:hypothetical protein CC80DRAFT_518479 [Byssothecium circinans]|uniref:Zn(2)-C6 fungal-type domain-containing protein n=1 Tax=Byssothecium circinans TaxID=147558 RepID=A0A6A5TJU1_9PLEO|nr:hypothetical protein CC80DRAFT_518479 [Byssothecium circinans]
MPRLADPKELGGAYVYPHADGASYTTGINIPVAGIVGACLTCRKRRVKCDECKPYCGQCSRSGRECVYGQVSDATTSSSADGEDATRQRSSSAHVLPLYATKPPLTRKPIGGDIDPKLSAESPEPRFDLSPLTLTNSVPSPNSGPIEWYELLAEYAINNIQKHNLGFDQTGLSRRRSPIPEAQDTLQSSGGDLSEGPIEEPWQSSDPIPMNNEQLGLFQHFVSTVGPILDLFDPSRQFSNAVPRLAVHHVGLLWSLLAVAARHMALLHADAQAKQDCLNVQTPGSTTSSSVIHPLLETATKYYYETLVYLRQDFLYPYYLKSKEIIATALLISTYEMCDASGRYSNGAWERHLYGIFCIQKSQDNNGESKDGLRRAAWWSWLCVDFAANEKKYDMPIRIHPPSYAAAIQTFHFARIIVLINWPSMGGMHDFGHRQRFPDESVETICGISMIQQGRDLPSAFVNYQALYAAEILRLLEKTLEITKFPPKTLLDDLTSYWRPGS